MSSLLLDQSLVLIVYLNLLLSSYNVFLKQGNLARNQLCNHLLDQLQFFECYYMFLDHFLQHDQKVFSINHYSLLFRLLEENILCVLFGLHYLQIFYLLPDNFDQLSDLNFFVLFLLIGIYSNYCYFKT